MQAIQTDVVLSAVTPALPLTRMVVRKLTSEQMCYAQVAVAPREGAIPGSIQLYMHPNIFVSKGNVFQKVPV